MQDRATENNSGVVVEPGSKEPFLMSAILSGGQHPQNLESSSRLVVKRRRSEDSGGSSSEPRSISPMDLTSKTPSSSSGQESPQDLSSSTTRVVVMHQEQSIKRRRLDDLLHKKFPSSSSTVSKDESPLSSRKRKVPPTSGTLSEEEEDANLRAGRLFQIAALMNSEVFKSNPLLYYGYYAQLIQSLARSNEAPEEKPAPNKIRKVVNINNNNSPGDSLSSGFKGYISPPEGRTQKKCSFNLSSLLSTPSSPSSATSSPTNTRPILDVSPTLSSFQEPGSPASSPDEEPRHKRAPRALTGRYVRPGTGASPRTLALLRQKIQERLRLRGDKEESLPPTTSGRKSNKKSKK